jgi:hypothetical protein
MPVRDSLHERKTVACLESMDVRLALSAAVARGGSRMRLVNVNPTGAERRTRRRDFNAD